MMCLPPSVLTLPPLDVIQSSHLPPHHFIERNDANVETQGRGGEGRVRQKKQSKHDKMWRDLLSLLSLPSNINNNPESNPTNTPDLVSINQFSSNFSSPFSSFQNLSFSYSSSSRKPSVILLLLLLSLPHGLFGPTLKELPLPHLTSL
jgi:hypothetical protein